MGRRCMNVGDTGNAGLHFRRLETRKEKRSRNYKQILHSPYALPAFDLK